MLATAIMVMVAGGVAVLSSAVQVSNQAAVGRSTTLQHGRVALERIQRRVNTAHASTAFPGFVSFSESLPGYEFPDTLVVWSPGASPQNPDGLPLMNELVVFCPDPSAPMRLLEIRAPDDDRVAPPLSDGAGWLVELNYLKNDTNLERVELTNLVRVAEPFLSGTSYAPRAAIRFEVTLRPTDAEWNEFQAATRPWDEISWVQDLYGAQSGLRQNWCRIELQLRPSDVDDNSRDSAIPFFGSGAIYYDLRR